MNRNRMRQTIILTAALLFSNVPTHASEASIYINKTRAELAKLYAPISGVEQPGRLMFNVDVGGTPCVIAYAFSREIATGARCTINNADLTKQRDALARWSKLLKAVLGDRRSSDVQIKLDGVQVVGEIETALPTAIYLTGSWDEKYKFLAAFGGPAPKAAGRTELFEMSLSIFPKDSEPPG